MFALLFARSSLLFSGWLDWGKSIFSLWVFLSSVLKPLEYLCWPQAAVPCCNLKNWINQTRKSCRWYIVVIKSWFAWLGDNFFFFKKKKLSLFRLVVWCCQVCTSWDRWCYQETNLWTARAWLNCQPEAAAATASWEIVKVKWKWSGSGGLVPQVCLLAEMTD